MWPKVGFYSDAVAWAYENEITEGVTDTLFAPNTDVTREQLVTFLYRYAQRKGLKTEQWAADQYPDAGSIGNFAVEPMTWAVTMASSTAWMVSWPPRRRPPGSDRNCDHAV